jgi:preprotein translocase subunit YajC
MSFFFPGRVIMTIALYFVVIRPERQKTKAQAQIASSVS